ncbi:MAG: hypothetical protein ISR58_04250 [Anaerolineales bacterium]|nr:hypothetical protein [Chloroflexota bacterium]MBL6980385.1 hypothetical protein [Anaerolineales bacterium]
MNKKLSTFFIILGFLFLLNAIFGRYIVLPGYLASLEAGGATLEGASQVASPWKIIRYLLWGYSFKFGIYFIILGAMLRTDMSSARKWIIAIGGFVYIGFAYMPLPNPTSIIFGIAGGIMTVLMIYIFLRWAEERNQLLDDQKTARDYRMAGYFFFGMATYTLCPLLGVKAFALSPEKMIQFGLQAEAASLSFHLLIELVLGWLFVALSLRKSKNS